MPEYDFTLLLAASAGELDDVMENALYDAGCDDSSPGMRMGRITVSFDREADSFREAVESAIADVKKAGYEVFSLDLPNEVTQIEIARRLDTPRQTINNYIAGNRGNGDFPLPISNLIEESPRWDWCEVTAWLWANEMIDKETFLDAQYIEQLNQGMKSERVERLAG